MHSCMVQCVCTLMPGINHNQNGDFIGGQVCWGGANGACPERPFCVDIRMEETLLAYCALLCVHPTSMSTHKCRLLRE